jgi:hypothetical protein
MRLGAAAAALLVSGFLIGSAGCTGDDQPDRKSKGAGPVSESFDSMMIAEIKTLKSITLWRVGPHAVGPGRNPEVPIAVVAANNGTGWAFAIQGDGRFDGTNIPGVLPVSTKADAQVAVVELIKSATGRGVEARWRELGPDTWTATATFAD